MYPSPLPAFRTEIQQHSEISESSNSTLPFSGRLVLVSSDSCRACADNLPQWKQLLDSVRHLRNIEVWFVSFEHNAITAEVVESAKTANMQYQVRSITNSVVFGLRTGIVAVPSTLLLEEGTIPVMVKQGKLSVDETRAFASAAEALAGHVRETSASSASKSRIP